MRRHLTNIFTSLLAVISAAVMPSCSGSDEPTPEPEPDATDRTILVYMVADNNLGSYYHVDDDNIAQMEEATRAGHLNGGNLVVYHDGASSAPELRVITPEQTIVIKSYSENESSLSVSRMQQVIEDVRTLFPATQRGLVMWSHGTGWLDDAASRTTASTYSFGQDDNSSAGRTTMKITTLAQALDGEDFDFIYFDCCLMASVEVAYQLRTATKAIIASGTELPIEGMPYAVNIPAMFEQDLDLSKIAANTLDFYLGPTVQYKYCTISVVMTEPLQQLAQATADIMRTGATPLSNYVRVPYFRRSVPSYTWDMADYIRALPVDPRLLDAWNDAFGRTVVYAGATPQSYGLDMSRHTGLGCFIPSVTTDSQGIKSIRWYNHRDLDWHRDVTSLNPSYHID
ncbi:clostripain-related cysteine peptidase [Paramuribaculum intestinale]|uniref:clostripain-related cysteine peptidase n=1 Tax=Paramuribaculum intestinale TaxID=2094151 RepID=UPI0025AFFF82|nr:clostripain-related cysteine peptidase [Paramuribaculum intestinale]